MAAPGDIGMSLEEAKTLLSALQWEFVAAQAAEITECARQCKRRAASDEVGISICVAYWLCITMHHTQKLFYGTRTPTISKRFKGKFPKGRDKSLTSP
jgi:hypothetical protein